MSLIDHLFVSSTRIHLPIFSLFHHIRRFRMNLGDICMEFWDIWMMLCVLCWENVWLSLIYLEGEYYYGDLFEHYCKVLLAHWIGKNEHQKKMKKKIRKKKKRCKLCLPCAWCDYFIFLWVLLLDELKRYVWWSWVWSWVIYEEDVGDHV